MVHADDRCNMMPQQGDCCSTGKEASQLELHAHGLMGSLSKGFKALVDKLRTSTRAFGVRLA